MFKRKIAIINEETGEIKAYDKFCETDCSTLIPVVQFSSPIQRAFVIQNDLLNFREPQYEKSRSQDLVKTYHDVGMFYFLDTKEFLSQKTLFTSKMSYFELDENEIQDIDTMSDWEMAEIKYEILKKRAKNGD